MPINSGQSDFRGKTMRYRAGQPAIFGLGSFCRGLAAVVLLAAVAGCTSTSIEDAAPQSATVTGPKDTGSYPNLNIPPQQAAEQFTDADKNAKLAALQADQAAANAAAGSTAGTPDSAELDRLAKTHASDTLKQIEGKCDPALDPTCK
jgi:hypothetical protein